MNYLAWPRDGSRWPLYAGLGLGVGLGTGSFVENDACEEKLKLLKDKCKTLPKAMVNDIVTYAQKPSVPKRGEELARKIFVWARFIIEGVQTRNEHLWATFVQTDMYWSLPDDNSQQTEIDFRRLVEEEKNMKLALRSTTPTLSPFFLQRAGAHVVGITCGVAAASGIVNSIYAHDVFIYGRLAEVADAARSLKTGTFNIQKKFFVLKCFLLALHMHLLHEYSRNTIRQRIEQHAQKQQAENSKT